MLNVRTSSRRGRWHAATGPIWSGLAIVSVFLLQYAQETCASQPVADSGQSKARCPSGMVWISGGEFTMGTNDPRSLPNERPAHRVTVEGFWMDIHDVTNAEFAKFVEATGYVTTAERKPDWEELKKQLPPGTLNANK